MKGIWMNQPKLRFANKSDLNELYEVYLKNFPDQKLDFKTIEIYFNTIENSILLGLVDDKMI